jgi:hypothetical protein
VGKRSRLEDEVQRGFNWSSKGRPTRRRCLPCDETKGERTLLDSVESLRGKESRKGWS